MTLKGGLWGTDEYATKPSPETSPKIPTCKKNESFKIMDPACALLLESSPHLSLSLLPPLLSEQALISLNSKATGSSSLSQASPRNLSPRPPFSDFPVSSGSRAQALLLLLLC